MGTRLRVNIIWLGKKPFVSGRDYKLKLGTTALPVRIHKINKVIDASEAGSTLAKDHVGRHDVADLVLEARQPIAFDLTADCEATGRFVIVDEYDVAGGGIITEADLRRPARPARRGAHARLQLGAGRRDGGRARGAPRTPRGARHVRRQGRRGEAQARARRREGAVRRGPRRLHARRHERAPRRRQRSVGRRREVASSCGASARSCTSCSTPASSSCRRRTSSASPTRRPCRRSSPTRRSCSSRSGRGQRAGLRPPRQRRRARGRGRGEGHRAARGAANHGGLDATSRGSRSRSRRARRPSPTACASSSRRGSRRRRTSRRRAGRGR